jgi:lipopolysaccharide transport protein LptA
MSNFRRLPHFPVRLLTGPAAVALALLFAAPLASQTLTNAFGGLSASSKDPIDIESDVLVVHDKEKYATFKGNVKAVQGTTTLRARELNVYVGGDKLTSETKKGSEGQPAASTKVSDAEDGSVGNKNNSQTTNKVSDAEDGSVGNKNHSQTTNKVSDAEDGGVGNNNDSQTTNMLGSSKDPIDIESDLFVVHDKEKYATFRGNVKAVQGTTTLRAGELKVNYVGGDKLAFGTNKEGGGEPAASTKVSDTEGDVARSDNNAQITKIEARGDVVITSEKDQRKNVLKGDRLVIDPKTGEIRFENTRNAAAGGRVRALFMPKVVEGAKSDGARSSETKPGDATVEDETSSSDKPEVARASDGVPDVQGDGAGSKNDGDPEVARASDGVPDMQGDGAGSKNDGDITKIEAKGDVVITSERDLTTTGDWALYDVPAQLVTVGGNVVSTQGKNVLKGDRFVIDLKTGESRFDNTGNTAAGGRIRALFMPKGATKAAKPGDAKSNEDDWSSSDKPDAAGANNETPADSESPDNVWPPRSENEP